MKINYQLFQRKRGHVINSGSKSKWIIKLSRKVQIKITFNRYASTIPI